MNQQTPRHQPYSHSIARLSIVCLFALAALFSVTILALRYWILPNIDNYRLEIAQIISKRAEQLVSIDRINAHWNGVHPYLQLHGVKVYDQAGTPALILTEVEGTLSWHSILHQELRFREIKIDRPTLIMRRDAHNVIHIAGTNISDEKTDAENSFIDWLLRQEKLVINQTDIYWLDEYRNAPALYLKIVNLLLHSHNLTNRHQLGLRVAALDSTAMSMDIRGDFTGKSIESFLHWQGRLYFELKQIDLAVWRQWIPFPDEIDIRQGKGALRGWLTLAEGTITDWLIDTALHQISANLGTNLPKLELDFLQGRIDVKQSNQSGSLVQEWTAHQLNFKLAHQQIITNPINAIWRQYHDPKQSESSNYLQIDEIDVGVWANLLEYLPVDASVRKQVEKYSPHGKIEHMQLSWKGSWSEPHAYQLDTQFNDLSLNNIQIGHLISIHGLSGNIQGTEQEGRLNLNSQSVSLQLRQPFPQSIVFDTLATRVGWKKIAEQESTTYKIEDLAFNNQHLAGSAIRGSYVHKQNKPDWIDIQGNLNQADVNGLSRLLLPFTNKTQLAWIDESSLSGQLKNTQFNIQGNLSDSSANDFSWSFATEMVNISASIGAQWPSITNISGHLTASSTLINAIVSEGNIETIQFKDTSIHIADLQSKKPLLKIKGEATGKTKQIIQLIKESPLTQNTFDIDIPGVITGKGKLQFESTIPILSKEKIVDIDLKGQYQFINNQIDLGPELPAISKVNGKVSFTHNTWDFDEIHAQLLGGPLVIRSKPLNNDKKQIALEGQANFDRFNTRLSQKSPSALQFWLQHIHGTTDWTAIIDMNNSQITALQIASSLNGVTSVLPAPFSKTHDEIIPLTFTKTAIDSANEKLFCQLGEKVTTEIHRTQTKQGDFIPVRGVMSFGNRSATLPSEKLTLMHGPIPLLEWDKWQEMLDQHEAIVGLSKQQSRGIDALLTHHIRFDLNVGVLDFLGSRFNDFILHADKQGSEWTTDVTSREVTGKIYWNATGKKKATARLKKLVVPESLPENGSAERKKHESQNWPIIDLHADEFFYKEKLLGQLTLLAEQNKENWVVDQMEISHKHSIFTAKGIWKNRQEPFSMYAEIKLTTSDIGKFLNRVGYPDRIARGEGSLEGHLSWQGKPFSVDFPTLSGQLKLAAKHGQFTKFKPGMSKLLGIFDLKALPRRLTLDFYDIFSQGFGFDDILGNVRIDHGIATFVDLEIAGSSAYLAVSGEINLDQETQSLRIKMFPSLGLVTPVIGIASMIADLSLKDPFGRVMFNEYAITGTWDEPLVKKLSEEN
ncbi:MAG TPA: YhdP family protein [Nitrosomonas sp.]|nr:YhdP family protein [Nitrosomonas sp.]